MNEDTDPQVPAPGETPAPEPVPAPRPKKPVGYWLKRLLACNPFYLVSAALLLYGCYRISTDPGVLHNNHLHLFFNFSSIQLYELLLVVTALFLAPRRIWYDSTLLVALENLLLLVPFILISQGALIGDSLMERPLMFGLCVGAGIMASVRLASLNRFLRELNFNRRALLIALGFLAANVALPIVYRTLQESKFGTHLESGAAYYTNELVWMILLPALCALAWLVPAGVQKERLWPERRWLPVGLFGLWLAATGTHLYCLGYIYDFNLRGELLAPALWMLMWVVQSRSVGLFPKLGLMRETMLLFAPLLATCVAISSGGNREFLSLTIINAVIYGLISVRRGNRLALHLSLISVTMLVAGFPLDWGQKLFPGLDRAELVGGAIAAYALAWPFRSRHPAFGILGGVVAGVVVSFGLGDHPNTIHWAFQAGFVFLLLHSLRWQDSAHFGAAWVRLVASGLWVAHALLWMHTSGAGWMACCVAAPLLVGCLLRRILTRAWGPWVLPVAAILVALSGPGDTTVMKVQTLSAGLLATLGSFFLFGLGTLAALTRHRRHKMEPAST